MRNEARRLHWVQYLGFIAIGFVFNLTGPLLPTLQQDLGMNYSQAGMVLSSLFFGEVITVLAGGLLSDQVGKKPYILIGSVLFSGGLLCSALAHDYRILLICTVVTGMGFGTYEIGMNTLCANMNDGNKGFAMNFMHMFFGFGAILAPVLVAGCLSYACWRAAFALVAILPMAVTVLLWPINLSHRPKAVVEMTGSAPLYRTWFIWLASIMIFIYVGFESLMICWTPSYWKGLGVSSFPASLTVTVFWFTVTVGRFLSSLLVNWTGLSRFIIGMSTGSILPTVVWCLFPTQIGTLTAIVLIGLLVGGMYPTIMATTVLRYPTKTGEITTLITLSAGLSGFLVASCIGRLVDTFSLRAIPWAGLSLAFLMTVCSLWLGRFRMQPQLEKNFTRLGMRYRELD